MQLEQRMAFHVCSDEYVGVIAVMLFVLCTWYFT